MKQSKLVLCMAVMGMAGAAWAEGDVSVEVTSDFFSKYVWRGQNVTDDWVFQPGISATYGGLTAGFWGSLDLTDENDESGEFIEYDYYLDYSGQINETVGYSVGGIYYYFPGGDPTTELYAGVSLDTIVSPSLTVYYDIEEVDGAYAALGFGHSIESEDLPCGIDLSANLGWGDSSYNDAYWGVDDGELNDLTLSAAFPFEVGPVTVTPSVTYVAVLGSDVSDVAGDDDSLVYAGVGLAYGF
ncbi:MAG: hypothetical protein JSW27_00030 [Phycisphaerales bacterium]|nr:MAG: hypothetical protein JSW27_00030 [Phycisphaerales bacterium]